MPKSIESREPENLTPLEQERLNQQVQEKEARWGKYEKETLMYADVGQMEKNIKELSDPDYKPTD